MVPPRRFSNISEPGDISHTERHGGSKRQRLDKNAHFDQMIQSMSAVNRDRDRRRRKESSDAYSPSRSTALASELSFIKRTDTRRSSSASKASSETSSSHTCNPLPQWLVNTFMTLSKKNPLRLMLPSDTSEGTDSGLHPQTETTAQSIGVSATDPSFVFDLLEPSGIQAQKSEDLIALPQTNLVSDDDQENWPEPLPFSTPGPGSLLGSSVASNIDLSLHIPKKDLSTVSYANDTYIGSNLPSNRSHTPIYSSDFLPSDPYIDNFATDEVGSSWKLSMPEEDSQSLFSNIYSTSGPHYCAPRPVHFDSPLEDPMSSDHLQPGNEIDYDTIDFHWKPFDRKNLVVSDRLQKPIHASRPVHSNGASDTSEYEHAVKPVNTETNTLKPYRSPGPASPLLSISPTPFRFLVPPESDASSSIPKSQVQNAIQKPSTPKKSLYFEVPGVYISPLDEHRKVHDTNYPARHHNENAGDSVEQANSQASNDSIESWEQNLC